ncbi:type II secretion system protein N [Syntrophorhabdus aromaticivorans]|uniref:Type II secretion system protein GspC N-terminal domain-containing protein n=1 Tax=Syntrophorhabdus aromaticivorans TaxID=328301 RepID=A0A971M2R1_9BACT|nr:type II secretion system protein N [Syntrophorhabdus aromaticivorans]NLW34673.1 hypothetical protein [Syntrophorhabdus aromaticivorans]
MVLRLHGTLWRAEADHGIYMTIDEKLFKNIVFPSALSVFFTVIVSLVLLMLINSSFMRMPLTSGIPPAKPANTHRTAGQTGSEPNYDVIGERNLFRAKLQMELPKPKTKEEIEEEVFVNTIQNYSLKGVWVGTNKRDNFAFIDKGPEKGVWIHRNGDRLEGEIILADIRPNAVLMTRGGLGATLTLFTKGFVRTQVKKTDTKPGNTQGKVRATNNR